MLKLSRRVGESIIINDSIEVTITEIKGNTVKIGVQTPEGMMVYRKELYDKIQEANRDAAKAATLLKDIC